MPELPYILLYVERLAPRLVGHAITRFRITGPATLQTVSPAPAALVGRRITGLDRLNKRVVLHVEGGVHVVIHLMVLGRLHWSDDPDALPQRKFGLAALGVAGGTLLLNEYGTKRRATIHLVDDAGLDAHRRAGLDVTTTPVDAFAAALRAQRRTLKRALSDPDVVDGVGNAWSDEILHEARMSPSSLTTSLDDDAIARLHDVARTSLLRWTDRLRAENPDALPRSVTAFHPGMRVHGRYGQPCPACGTAIQRIVYADNESNYCPRCQTEGRLLSDRAFARLLKDDWPRTIEALEARRTP